MIAAHRRLGGREVKLLAAPLASVAGGVFEGYASLFGVADLGKDVVAPGAFNASLARRGVRGVRMLWQHDPAEPIGRWLAIAEDSRGLFVRGRLNLAVARAREIHALMKEGAIDGLSIGFRAERARHDRTSGLRRLERLDLWEISLVTFPMLPGARVEAVKARNILPPREGRGRGGAAARPIINIAADGEGFLLARAIGEAARRLSGC
jgi:HK97 family phage prohead protease